jgi:putative ABC transport system permease protein
MRPSNDLRPMPGERLYRFLLRLYPAEFRVRYGESMVEFYRDRWRAEATPNTAASIWREIAADLVRTALPERVVSLVVSTPRGPARPKEKIMSILAQDVRYALRGLAHRPAFTLTVVATIALGIGANVAIFSVVNGVLLRPLPFPNAERVVEFNHLEPYQSVAEMEFVDYRREMRSLQRIAAWSGAQGNLTGDGEAERLQAVRVSDGFFGTLGVPPFLGRTFTADEDQRGGPPVLVMSYGLWQRRFAGDQGIVGKRVMLNGTPRTVVGVMPKRFDYPNPGVSIWVPLRLNLDSLDTRNNHYLQMVARLAPEHTISQAIAEATTLGRRWATAYPDIYSPGKPLQPRIQTVGDALVGASRPYLFTLLGAVAFVLLIACVNVANLLLARGEGRRKELAIRTALGASRGRVVTQLLTESVLLALMGGAGGLALAWWGSRILIHAAPAGIPRIGDIRMDVSVLLFTVGVSLATGMLFGLAPAWRAAASDTSTTLKEGGKTSAHGGVRSARAALVVAEVALAVVMLTGAGLLVRSLRALQQVDLGFDPSSTLTLRLALPPREYDDAKTTQFIRDIVDRAAAMPGVRSAAAVGCPPMSCGDRWSILIDGRVVKTIAEAPSAQPVQVTPEYFKTLGMRLRRGRAFTAADRIDAPMVAVVNETMARQLWPGQDVIGHTLKMFNPEAPWVTIVGLVADMKSDGVGRDVPPTMFFPYDQAGKSAYYTPKVFTLALKTDGDPAARAVPVREAVRALDRNVPVSDVRTMEDLMGGAIAGRRFATTVLAGFAALALVLAAIGIYGVIAYSVSQRTYEIGLRMALGAEQGSVLRLVLSEALRLSLAGLLLGAAAAVGVGRLIQSLLVGVGVADLLTFGVVAAALVGVALLASAVPARRAMTVNPTEALRNG